MNLQIKDFQLICQTTQLPEIRMLANKTFLTHLHKSMMPESLLISTVSKSGNTMLLKPKKVPLSRLMDLKDHTVISILLVNHLLQSSGHNLLHLNLLSPSNLLRMFSRLSFTRLKLDGSSSQTALEKMVKSGSKLISLIPLKLLAKLIKTKPFLHLPLL